MKLSVPFNGDPGLLGKINKGKVVEVYGKLSRDFTGGGRAACINPRVSKEKLINCVKQAHILGIEFSYLINATCFGNSEWTRCGQQKLRSLLDWLAEIGVDNITVASSYLVELIKKKYPFKIHVSSMTQIKSIRQAKMWEELGADEIALSQIDVNRNFPLIEAIRHNVGCKIKVIVNEDCLFHCPNYFYHANIAAHASQNTLGNYFLDYCRIDCRLKKLRDPANFIRASWIRPEDTHYYEKAGVDIFKVIDRGMSTEALMRIVQAYTMNRYDGNLLDLLPHPSINLTFNKSEILTKIRYFFKPFYVNVFKLYKVKSIMADFDAYIDNRALDGFIDFFLGNNCELKSCRECGYCEEIAKKAVKVNKDYLDKAVNLHRNFLDKIVSGDIFKY